MKLFINPACSALTSFVENLPDMFDMEGQTLYKARNELKVFTPVEGWKVTVKSFKTPHPVNRIAYTFFRPSKALRSYRYAFDIQARGFHTPEPVACVLTFRGGLLHRSFYVSAYSGGETMRREFCFLYPMDDRKARVLRAFTAFTARLHEAGIYHHDYSNGNILYAEEKGRLRFELVDLNRIRFQKVSQQMGWKAFHRLDFSLEMLETVAREYALQRHLDVEESIVRIREYNIKTMKPYTSFPDLKKNRQIR
jgi:hypothetical protein